MGARRESGLTVRAWCTENKIQEKTYYYWQRKLREAACEQSNEQEHKNRSLIPTGWSMLAPAAPKEEYLTIEIGSSRIRANKNTSTELLSKVCSTLMKLC